MTIPKKILLLFLFLPVIILVAPAQNYTISGYITDNETGEQLIAATVFDELSAKGNASNNFGFFSLTLPKGEVSLTFSYIGYQPEKRVFALQRDTVIHIGLSLQNILQEVTVIGHRSETGVLGSQMSAVEVPVAQIKNIPSLLGENDIIKALQLLPGVQSGTEGSAGLYVRGGGPDENLLLLDGIPLYNVNHMMGFFSVFNSDALKNVTLYKGSFPARFGGRLSSVVDVRMKDGDDKKISGTASIGTLSAKLQMEGPIVKEKTTFNVSLRRTYFDLLAQPLIRYAAKQEGDDTSYNGGYFFYDVNAKFTHKFSDRDRLYLSVYGGNDVMHTRIRTKDIYNSYSENKEWQKLHWGWGNVITALRWSRVAGSKLFMNTTAAFTRYRSSLNLAAESEYLDKTVTPGKSSKSETEVKYNSGIHDWTVKADFDYTPNPQHDIKFGTNYTYHTFSPDISSIKLNDSDPGTQKIDTVVGSPKVRAHETMSYIEDNITLGKLLKVNLGVHFSSFHVQKENYFSVQPRVGLRVSLAENLSAKAGYAYMNQYIHLLSNSSVSLPTDLWVPVTKRIKPMSSHQYSAGVFYTVPGVADFSAEGYYKTMDNLLEYRDGASFMGASSHWEEKVSMGRGTAYGVEFLVQRSFGNSSGWLGYTWSKSDRIFDRPGHEINGGKAFPAKYDRRHDVSLTLMHKFSDRFDISGSWVYSTGNAATFGYQSYRTTPAPNYQELYYTPPSVTYVESRNNFRYNDYHRMDLGVNFHKTTRRGWKRTWNISVYNVYNQLNPFFVYPSSKTEQTGPNEVRSKTVLKQVSIFPVLPSVTYVVKF